MTTECGLKIELMISEVDCGENGQIEASIQVGIVRVALSLFDVLFDFWLMPRHAVEELKVYEGGFYDCLLHMMFSRTEVHGLKDESAERHLYEACA